jgi:hypothetical protein
MAWFENICLVICKGAQKQRLILGEKWENKLALCFGGRKSSAHKKQQEQGYSEFEMVNVLVDSSMYRFRYTYRYSERTFSPPPPFPYIF